MDIIQITGRLGADPESRFTASGQKVTTLIMAINKKRGGKEETIWWRVTLWGERFDKMLPYLKKGSLVTAVGDLSRKPEIYMDKMGQAQVGSLELTAEFLRFPPTSRQDRDQGREESPASALYGQPAQPNKQAGFSSQSTPDSFGSSASSDPFTSAEQFSTGRLEPESSPKGQDDIPF